MVVRGVVFDLDDTLYLERDYVQSGFRAVSRLLAEISDQPEYHYLSALNAIAQDARYRGRVFDELLGRTDLTATTTQLVMTYREHEPQIALLPGASGLLQSLEDAGLQLGMITDGPVSSQTRKLAALGLRRAFSPTVLTDRWGIEFRKPSDRAFQLVERCWKLSPNDLVYVGDNPKKDFTSPRRRGWRSIRLRHPNQLHANLQPTSLEASPTTEAVGFDGLSTVLKKWTRVPRIC